MHASACLDLAAMGARAGLDLTGEITWHRHACNLGDDTGCLLLARDLISTGSAKAAADAIPRFARLCAKQMADACVGLVTTFVVD